MSGKPDNPDQLGMLDDRDESDEPNDQDGSDGPNDQDWTDGFDDQDRSYDPQGFPTDLVCLGRRIRPTWLGSRVGPAHLSPWVCFQIYNEFKT